MTRSKYLGLLALLLTGLLTSRAQAAEQDAPQPYVVIVGIDRYQDTQILARKHAEADARALYDVFTDKDSLAVDGKHVRLLLGSPDAKRNAETATRANILKALTWAAQNARRDDLVIVALFTQAAPLGERVCYFVSDSTFKDRAKNAVDSGDVQGALDKLKSRRFVAFLDVNFMGFDLGKEPPPDLNTAALLRVYLGKEDDKTGAPTESRVIFLANSGLKPSLELKDQGLFAKVLTDGLKGKADREGYEPDGLITVSELAKYVREQAPAQIRQVGKAVDQAQLPAVLENQNNDFILTLNPPVAALVKKQLAAFDAIAKAEKLPKDVVEQGHNLLSRMPKLEAQQNLRKAYQKLADGKLKLPAFRIERTTILASMRLREVDAASYARMVMRATDVVREAYVKAVNQGQLVDYAIRGLYDKIHEKVPSKVEKKLRDSKGLQKADLLKLLTESRLQLGKREDLDNGKDVTYSLHAMLGKLDKHTDYSDKEAVDKDNSVIYGHFMGIGVQIRKNVNKDMLQVVTPIMGSPAYQAKMYAGDIITTIIREVDDEGKALAQPEVIPTKGLSTEDAVKKIKGLPGTRVKLVVEREGAAKPLTFSLIRGKVEVETVLGHKRNDDDSWNYVIDPENKICYVRLTQFARNSARDLEKVMRKLSKAGIKGFILDMRFNPGGLLDCAVKISDLFIDDGVIVTIRPRNGPETSYVGHSDGSYTTFPMVCLVNGYSASASEIVAACLQDHGRAVVVGSRTYGKGSVQTILPFAETGGELKLTTATYWRPSNKNINKASTRGRPEDEWGVMPDPGYKLDLPYKELNDLQDHQRDAEIIQRPDRRNQPAAKDARPGFRDRQLDLALRYLRDQIRTASGRRQPAVTTRKGG
jgi:carboxyl-terminal processing protease